MAIKLNFPKDFEIKIKKFEDSNQTIILEELQLDSELTTPRSESMFEARAPRTSADRMFGFR